MTSESSATSPKCAVLGLVACLALACASGGPAVLSSTPENVAVEYNKDDKVASTSQIANEACSEHGGIAEFDEVQETASPETRVAKYRCVRPAASSPASEEPAPAEAGDAEADEAEAEGAEEAPATESSED